MNPSPRHQSRSHMRTRSLSQYLFSDPPLYGVAKLQKRNTQGLSGPPSTNGSRTQLDQIFSYNQSKKAKRPANVLKKVTHSFVGSFLTLSFLASSAWSGSKSDLIPSLLDQSVSDQITQTTPTPTSLTSIEKAQTMSQLLLAEWIRLELLIHGFTLRLIPSTQIDAESREFYSHVRMAADGANTVVAVLLTEKLEKNTARLRFTEVFGEVRSLNNEMNRLITQRLDSEQAVIEAVKKFRLILAQEQKLVQKGLRFSTQRGKLQAQLDKSRDQILAAEERRKIAERDFSQLMDRESSLTGSTINAHSQEVEDIIRGYRGSTYSNTDSSHSSETAMSSQQTDSIEAERLNSFRRKMGLTPTTHKGTEEAPLANLSTPDIELESMSAQNAPQFKERFLQSSQAYAKRKQKWTASNIEQTLQQAAGKTLRIGLPVLFTLDFLSELQLQKQSLSLQETDQIINEVDKSIAEMESAVF